MTTTALSLTAIDEIDGLAKEYADAREQLADRVQKLQDELEAAKRRLIKGIKAAAAEAALRRSQLEQKITAHPDLFVKPRTMTLHGIKLGFAKGKGKVEFSDADKVVELVWKLVPEQAGVLIKTRESPNKEALETLDAATLKKLGVSITGTDDQVVIKAASDDVDKLVAKILEEDAAPEAA